MNELLYQADPEAVEAIHRIRQAVHHCCSGCMHRRVRVQTIDGHVYEGTIAGIDQKHLYLSVPQAADERLFYPGFFNPAANVILPLVLYELLVISLLG
jgi:hypothetical protein